MRHLIIGGPPGGGKTTVARRLARRHGLRLYSTDTRTWVHRDCAVQARLAAALRWESRTPETRWRQPLDELFATSLHRERGAMALEDLRRLPERPLAVAEGSVLPAAAVADALLEPSRALWLLPTRQFQDAQLARRGTAEGPAVLYRHLRELEEREARTHRIRTLVIDGTAAVSDVVGAVEQQLGLALREGPHAETMDERRALLREINEAVVEQVRGYHRQPWACGDPEIVVARFVCECGDPACEHDVEAPVSRAAARPVLAEGHRP